MRNRDMLSVSGTGLNHYSASFPRSGADISLSDPDNIFGFSQGKANQNNDILLIVLVSLLTLTTFLALFVLRSLDDNRLTSWQWTVAGVDMFTMPFVLVIGIFLAFLLSNVSLPVRKPAIWLFIISFSASAIFWGEPEVIVDVSRYFVQAKYLELYGVGYFLKEWGNDITVWTDLPLVPLLYGLVFKVAGESRTGIQIFNALLFSGTVVLTYLIGRTLWDKTVGLYGGILLLGIPYLFTQVPLMLVDVPTMFFFALALFTTITAVKQGGTALLISASVTIVLAMLSKYSVWLMLSVIPVIFLSHLACGRKVILQRATVISLGVALLIGTVIFWKFNVFSEQLRLLQSYQVPGLKRWGESFTSTFFFQIHPYVTLAALFSIYAAIKKKDFKYAIISWLLLLVVVLEIKRARYLIVVLPMLTLMAAYGINEIRNVKISKFIISSTVISALVIAIFGYLPFLKNTSAVNLKQAGEYLDTMDAETIEVITLPQVRSIVNPAVSVPILDLHTRKTLVYRYDEDLVQRPGSVEKSSLRFTWEYRNPGYFHADSHAPAGTSETRLPVAIIFSHRNQVIPARIAGRIADYRLVKDWSTLDRVFKYQTIIRVYQPI
ncbi:MAG: hypothetical protein BMS9Abin33_1254 [Gammaproteobacteria bacterium]|nr:MAG: hypothetical protein BMS9Abin33_1254 [Gammaproteobacteria bacterium]